MSARSTRNRGQAKDRETSCPDDPPGLILWSKVYEVRDGHQTGRWQWSHQWRNKQTEFFPGYWMFGDAICVPPGVGHCITNVDEAKLATPITPESLAKSGTEHGEQMALFCWAQINRELYPVLKWMFAIPNGGGRSAAQGAMLKAEGVKGGVSDVCLPVQRRGYAGLYIEMKKAKGVPSDVKPEQKEFMGFVKEQGYFADVAFGWTQAVQILEWYLHGKDDSVP